RALEDQLKQRHGLTHAVVVRTAAGRSPEHVRRSVGYFAAPVASQWIRNGEVIGVAGGRTLAELVRFMAPRPEPAALAVVQLMGNVGANVTAIDAVELSRVLAQRLGGTLYTVSAPAFVADASSRDVFHRHEHVRSVWRLFDRMHTAFVGIGTLSTSVFIERGVLDQTALAALGSHGAVGEICGRFFDATGTECETPYRDRVISIDLDTLRRMHEVVGVTNGPDRARAVLAALRGGILKSLIIDEDGAAAVLGR
ncbi:MAG: sugar-binding domain-containing protein, partial [Armatimonadota bacterium]|nr:sugar-binding domain-containing protein [Armatimonadota bacterium]